MQNKMTACLVAGLFLSYPAGAAAPDAMQAQALEQQISDMLASLLGPQNHPVRLTPSGDHYQIELKMAPFYEPLGVHVSGLANATGTLAPLDGGRWSIDNVALPSPSHFVVDTGPPDARKTMTVDLNIHDPTSHNIVDPAFATPWTLTSASAGLDMTIDGKDLRQTSHAGPFNLHAAMTPAGNTRLNVTGEFELRDYVSDARPPKGSPLHTSIARLSGSLHLDRLDRVRISSALTLLQAAKARQTDGKPVPQREMNALLHQVILELRDAVAAGGVAEAIDGIAFEGGGAAFKLKHFAAGIEADAPTGQLGARMTLVLDGPSSPAIPPSALPYVPSHLAMQPYVSGLGLAELTQLALDATAPEPHPAADPSVLFAHGALTAGVEHLELIVGDTAIKGSGRVNASSPDQVNGHATVVAKNFDALVKNVQNDPVLGPQGLPVLLLVRGLAKPDGDTLVWDITYESGAVIVNGTDLSAITGGQR